MFLFVFIPLGWGGKNDVMKKPAMKKPAAAGSSDPTGHEHADTLNDTDKYNQAMTLTGGGGLNTINSSLQHIPNPTQCIARLLTGSSYARTKRRMTHHRGQRVRNLEEIEPSL